ncbi:MAG: 16S rRNA (cytidine(1402)-2'-O)-methyltransferase [Pseudomonadota bacterium]|nr:16S rRNA (cytidine(1402)-2'-O)-methyltransferase [Pseudomonadota bacterium]
MAQCGTLYVVATPIGNLGDMSARAIAVLQQVDLIAAEDTRHSGPLLQHFGITTSCIACHDHNEREIAAGLVARIVAGESVALISDAGTPLISDPGYHLVRTAREAGLPVVPVPGASAVIAALSVSGLPSDRFSFEGFLPAKSSARRQRLQTLVDESGTLIFYESTHRIEESLADMAAVFGPERYVVIAREITKRFETVHGDTLEKLISWIAADANQTKGEFVVMVHGAAEPETRVVDAETERVLKLLLEELPVKQAAALAAKITGAKKNALYQFALGLAE